MMRRILLAVAVISAATCGSAPTAPSPPPSSPPVPMPTAKIEVIPAERLELTSMEAGKGWNFQGQARNVAQGCASNVRGTATFRDAAGTVLQAVEFPVDGKVLPAQTVNWRACCLTEANGTASKAVQIDFKWQDVAC